MKVRNGFVSNSSSSSFCLLGVEIKDDADYEDYEDIKDLEVRFGIAELDGDYAGITPYSIGDDETIKQAKQKVIDILKKGGKNYEIDDVEWWVDGGYDS